MDSTDISEYQIIRNLYKHTNEQIEDIRFSLESGVDRETYLDLIGSIKAYRAIQRYIEENR